MSKLLDKSRIQVRLSYGRHVTGSDASAVRSTVASFRPHVYVMENYELLKETRNSAMAQFNHIVAAARADGKTKASLMRAMAIFSPFRAACFDAITNNPSTNVYFAEVYGKQELESIRDGMKNYARAGPVLKLLHQKKTDAALSRAEEVTRQYMLTNVVLRSERMAEGFEAMCTELPELFPGMEKQNPLRVFARYGPNHAALTEKLKSRGFSVSASSDSTILTQKDRFCRALGADPGARLADGEKAALLFDFLYYELTKADLLRPTLQETVALQMEKLEKLGGPDGFLSLLKSAALKHGLLVRNFVNELHDAIVRA